MAIHRKPKRSRTRKADSGHLVVAVFWKDAACVAPWRDDDGRGTLASCITVGMITESTDTHISVAQSFGESNSYASVMSIPRSTVISVRRFGRVGLK